MCTYSSGAAPQQELDNRTAVPGYRAIFADWRVRSVELRSRCRATCDLRFGDSPRAALDWFPAARPHRPTVVCIHGGYWQWNDRQDFAFVAEGLVTLGLNAAIVGYTLAPEARIAQMVEEISAAVDWLRRNAASLGAGPEIYLMGWSAGAHLAAMMLGRLALAGMVGVSGLYDLAPVRNSPLDGPLRLTEQDVEELSPQRRSGIASSPVRLACGGGELPELVRQTRAYAAALRAARQPVSLQVVPGRNHYDVLEEFARPGGVLLETAARAWGW